MIKITTEVLNELNEEVEKEFDFPESWEEVNFSQYVKLLQLELNKSKYISTVLWEQEFLEILANANKGELDALTPEQLEPVYPILKNSLTPEILNEKPDLGTDHFVINGITYSFYTEEGLKNLSLAEQAYLETLKTSGSPYEAILKAAAVQIRPAKLKTTKEGFKRWKLDRFNASDIEDRAKLFEQHLNIKILKGMDVFFCHTSNS